MQYTVDNIRMLAAVAETGSIEEVSKDSLFSPDNIVELLHELEKGVGRQLVTIDGDKVTVIEGNERLAAWAKLVADAEMMSLKVFGIDLFVGTASTTDLR